MTAIEQSLGLWIPQVQGQYINVDAGFGAQCWDLAAHWSMFIGLPVINTGSTATKRGRWPGWAGNMVDVFPQTPAIAAAYQLIGPDEPGLPGDIAVWGDSYWYYPKTHVAPLVADKGPQLQCMSQNSTPPRADNPYPGDSTGPTTIQSLPRQGLIGFIRPRNGNINPQGTTAPEEDDMPLTTEDINRVATEVLNRDIPREGEGQTGTTNLRAVIAWFDANNAGNVFQTATEVLNRKVPWFGFDGSGPTPGRDFTTLALATGYADTIGASQLGQIAALKEVVQQLAVKQGVVIDYDLIAEKAAKAVNDDAAKRMAK